MRALFLAIIFSVFLISCDTSTTTKHSLIEFVPEGASTLIKTNNIEDLKSSLSNNDLIQEFKTASFYKSLDNIFKNTTAFKPKSEALFCFSKDKNDSTQVTLITKYTPNLFQFDSLAKPKREDIKFKNATITKTQLNSETLYSVIIDSIFIGSTSKTIIENSLDVKPVSEELQKIYNTTATEKTFAVILDTEQVKQSSLFFSSDSIPLQNFTKYIALDTDITQDQITLNGITKASDSTNHLINIFKNTTPQENKTAKITPEDSDGFMSFTYQDFSNLQANLVALNKQEPIETTLFHNTNEIGVIYNKEHRAIVLHSLDDMATSEALLDSQEVIETFRQVDIKRFAHPEWFTSNFKPLIKIKTASLYAVLDSFFVFSDDLEMLQNVISTFQNKSTLSERDFYHNITEDLSDASSLMLVGNANLLEDILQSNFKTSSQVNTTDFKISAIQYIYDHDFAHVNAVIKKARTKATENSVSEELNIKLDAKLLNNPQFVTNHITSEKEIVVQDVNNNLYLISNKGKVLWKKQLDEAILGDISQIDMYKNGRLQFAFTTAHHLYILDRNGKDAKSFPINFKDKVTQPLAVFDYDNNKKYRLLVIQNQEVLMYDALGKQVKGFNFKKASTTIIHKPQHFRVSGKDYLVFKTTDKLYILSRTGEVRVTPKTAFTYSKEAVYVYNNKFATTTDKGDLILVDLNGKVSSENLNLGENHHIDATTRTLVTQSENKLTIRNKTLELDFGSYTQAKLFYINNKIYVTTTDLQAQKVYVFDSQGEEISNFPVYGTSALDIANLDKDKPLEAVTKGNDNAIIIYQIN
ncbi:ribonuclease HII [Formosa sp. PL04]|uniref:ribonuclease HII n=1 Tax=Formosa sp. PL04 TaxID=3081755 RepID=UPI0029828ED7|nr:ribonuclease HII [Formosa sp. PL04]MDW5287616.1 ribonuclease HII [Formosa sp. PL04]